MNCAKRDMAPKYAVTATMAVLLQGVVAPTSAIAFEMETHAAMTIEAIAASQLSRDLNASPVLKRLGLSDYSAGLQSRFPSAGDTYLYQGNALKSTSQRTRREVEISRTVRSAQGLQIPAPLTIADWFMRGAIREDDNTSESPDGDDPGGVFDRVFGHFFDPVLNRGLTVSVLGQTVLGPEPRAVDWALVDSARVQPILGGPRANQFKSSDAREAMWRALTLKTATMGEEWTSPGFMGTSGQ